MRHGGKLVNLKGGLAETALIRDVQWDALGAHVLHLDLARVSAQERVEVTVPIELRGEALGSKQGGIVEQLMHDVNVECSASTIPERISVNINDLDVGQAISIADIEVPDGVTLLAPQEASLVHCVAVGVEAEEEEALEAETGAEPEVIGRKAEESEEEGG